MRKVTMINKLVLFCLAVLAFNTKIKAQHGLQMAPPVNYIFSSDSLNGFDEMSAKHSALGVGAYGDEFKVFMYNAKRSFINDKYHLIKIARTPSNPFEPDPITNPYVPNTAKLGYPSVAVAA